MDHDRHIDNRLTFVTLTAFALSLLLACGGMQLPDPPESWGASEAAEASSASEPSAEREATSTQQSRSDTPAFAVLTDLNAALRAADPDAIFVLLSSETRLFLDSYHPDGGEKALEEERIQVDERWLSFDRDEILLGGQGLDGLRMLTAMESESVSARRSEFLVEGTERRIVVIREGDRWFVHLPSVPIDLLHAEGS